MNNIIRRLKKRMGFDKEAEPIGEGHQEVVKPTPKVKKVKKVLKEVEETEIEKLERELEELKNTETPLEEELKESEEVEEAEEPKRLTTDEVLLNHEQRLLQMEAKWFRLGGI